MIEESMRKTEEQAKDFDRREERRGEEELNALRTTGIQHEAEWENKMNSDVARNEMDEQKKLSSLQHSMQQKLDIFENAMLPDDYKPGGDKHEKAHLEKDIEDNE